MFHLFLAAGLLVLACAAVLQADLSGFDRICPLNRFRPRVKWNGVDVLLIFVLYFFSMILCARLLAATGCFDLTRPVDAVATPDTAIVQSDKTAAREMAGPGVDEQAREHPTARLLKRGKEVPALLLLALLAAVVAAPLVEEFLFRFLLQGWLEDVERRLRRRGFLRSPKFLRGFLPVVGVAFFFALIHLRGPGREGESLDMLVFSMLVMLIASALTLGLGLVYLAVVREMRLRDFGFAPAHLFRDTRAGLVCFVFVLPPMVGLAIGMRTLLPTNLVDPFPLFVFALGLGVLYFRTGRIVACLVMHAVLNLFSSLLALAA